MKIKILLTALIAAVISPSLTALAAGNSLYLSSSKSAAIGSTLAVAVRVSSGDPVNAVQANISYPVDKLDYVSTSYAGSAFEILAESSGGGGSVAVGRATMSPVTGNKLVATVNFRVKVASGSATINLVGGSTLANNGEAVSAGLGGAAVTFSAQAPKAAAPAAPPADKTPPTITDIKVTNIKPNSATVSWKTNEPSDSLVSYGLDSNYGLSVGSTNLTTEHSFVLSSVFIKPLNKYSFAVSSTDGSGNKQTSQPSSFKAAGIAYTIQVNNTKNKPLAGATVSVEGQKQKTNKSGRATVYVSEGQHTAVIDIKGKKSYKNFETIVGKDYTTKPLVAVFDVKGTSNFVILSVALIWFIVGIALGYIWHVSSSPIKYLEDKGELSFRHKYMKVSQLEKHYGDDDKGSNPFHKKTAGRLLNNLTHRHA